MGAGIVRGRLVVWVLVGLALTGCASVASRPAGRSAPLLPGGTQAGPASWYGHPHHGRRTASGEIFDMFQLTAAHPTLPFGTRVAVTNVDNGRTVEVRINDRGPFVGGRVIDVSYAAARRLGAVGRGVFPVTLRVVAPPEGEAAPSGRR